jgi:predicted glycoside hydrolase/deacetylase ChbG (UPF0249 family)
MPGGLLIVNADDFGGNRLATDRIAECMASGRVTSTSAMVYMSDSQRAANIARSQQLPTGLHLNITQAFDDPTTSRPVRDHQARVTQYFANKRSRRFTYNPVLSAQVRRCIADQLERFHELFGCAPSHIDGHNHAHLSPTVLFALPKGMPIRSGFTNDGSYPGALLRKTRQVIIRSTHATTDHFFAIDALGPSPTENQIDQMLGFADDASIEIMVHPDREDNYRLLMSDTWMHAVQQRTRGSFRDL